MIDRPFLRVGDAERARAASALDTAATEGRLTASELTDRQQRARLAKTRGELAATLEDVLTPDGLVELVTGERPVPRSAGGPGFSWDDPLVIKATWSDERRIGAWDVPPFLEVTAMASNVKLNFTRATLLAPVIDIVHLGGAGKLVIIVPPGWGVDSTRVDKGMAAIKNEIEQRAQPGQPQIVVRGRLTLANLIVRYPNRFDRWQQRRHLGAHGMRAIGS